MPTFVYAVNDTSKNGTLTNLACWLRHIKRPINFWLFTSRLYQLASHTALHKSKLCTKIWIICLSIDQSKGIANTQHVHWFGFRWMHTHMIEWLLLIYRRHKVLSLIRPPKKFQKRKQSNFLFWIYITMTHHYDINWPDPNYYGSWYKMHQNNRSENFDK